jgi:steroid 5-alpha reductase family enzyme
MIEERWARRDHYRRYQRETSTFVPLPPTSSG